MNYQLTIIITYFIIMSIVAFILYFIDKRRAIRHKWRISEATLLTVSCIGGSFGAFLAMKKLRHKTKHAKFYITVPLMMIIHIVIIIYAFTKFR